MNAAIAQATLPSTRRRYGGAVLGQRKPERAASSFALRLHPDPAPMHLHNALDQRQPDPCSLTLRIQSLEQPEDLLMKAGFDADAVVSYVAQDLPVLPRSPEWSCRAASS